jgi:terminal uridylyltransferase
MFPSSKDTTEGDKPPGNLEDHLRGLILNNSISSSASDVTFQGQNAPRLPPHMMTATPLEQNEYLARATARQNAAASIVPPEPSTTPRRRLNQAQRRQLNSQLSIPLAAQPVQGFVGNPYQPPATQQYYGDERSNNRRYQQNHQVPQFQQPRTSYAPHDPYSQNSQSSPRSSYNTGSQNSFQPRQSTNYHHQQQYGSGPPYGRPQPQTRQLYHTGSNYGQAGGWRTSHDFAGEISIQSEELQSLLLNCLPTVSVDPLEEEGKEAFRAIVEQACRDAIDGFEKQELHNRSFDASSVQLKCFGSMSSGFATKASDMDVALLTPQSRPAADSPESPIPRLIEKKLLALGYGARLLTRTRVPIIKLCERPTKKLWTDLMEERTRWESGFLAEEVEEEIEEVDEAKTLAPSSEPTKTPTSKGFVAEPITLAEPEIKSTYDDAQLSQLKQNANQTLGDYYNSAKRILRKLGAFDVSTSANTLSKEQSRILNNVCKAMIAGLSSEILSSRLRSYHSISLLFDQSQDFVQRSLNGVWTQIEGERMTLAFDTRPLTEANDRHEHDCRSQIDAWWTLQNDCGPLTDPLNYNRQLYLQCQKLKRFSSLQLVLLEQNQTESPSNYATRAQKIMIDLKGREAEHEGSRDPVTPIIIAHYVSGIRNSQIREEMHKFIHTQAAFSEICLQHRIFQLAADYEHALEGSLYDNADRPIIEQYITFLRSRSISSPGSITSTIISAENALLAKIRSLPDPAQTSASKPRDRYRDHLEFPKTEIGIQCDINFSADLALHNTLLLRCYSHCDPRVKPLVLFVKHWAHLRGINSPYRGTLSSYGYVLMVLHYLVNIAEPFVCPNLQGLYKEPPSHLLPHEIEAETVCNGRNVRFWRNEAEIRELSSNGMLNHNHCSMGMLLRGFFEYFAHGGTMSTFQHRGFDWGREVLSLRTQGGILSKQEKGWVGAKTVIETSTVAAPLTPSTTSVTPTSAESNLEGVGPAATGKITEAKVIPKVQAQKVEETKEIRYRYLFAIEDPFELDHNVARTVVHSGIVSIRDEFRRAWRLIKDMGKMNGNQNEGLLDSSADNDVEKSGLQELLDLIHKTD